MKTNIIAADISDAETLTSLAKESKAVWGYPEAWIESWRDELVVTTQHLQEEIINKLVDEKGNLIGYYRLVNKGDTMIINGFWVKPEMKGKGCGRKLFHHMVETAKANNAKTIEWESDPNATAFYVRMGAEQTGEKVYTLFGEKRVLPLLRYLL